MPASWKSSEGCIKPCQSSSFRGKSNCLSPFRGDGREVRKWQPELFEMATELLGNGNQNCFRNYRPPLSPPKNPIKREKKKLAYSSEREDFIQRGEDRFARLLRIRWEDRFACLLRIRWEDRFACLLRGFGESC